MPSYDGHDGTPLHYDVLGDDSSDPVIVLAGGAARDPAYLGDLAGLSRPWRLCVPHLRGVGRSPAPSDVEAGSYWQQAADVDRLRAHLGLDRCMVAGHSAGTRVAISYAAQFPDRLAGLLLITPPAAYLVDVPSDAEALTTARRGEPGFEAALAAQRAGPDTSSDETFNAWQQAIAATGYAAWGEAEREHSRTGGRWHLDAARAFFSVEPPADLADRLGHVTAPALVVAGARDLVPEVAQATALAGLFPAGRVSVIDRCGHHPWVEQPAAFRRAVDPFLERVSDLA